MCMPVTTILTSNTKRTLHSENIELKLRIYNRDNLVRFTI